MKKFPRLLLALFQISSQFSTDAASPEVKYKEICKRFNNETIICPHDIRVTLTNKFEERFLVKISCQEPQASISVLNGLSFITSLSNSFNVEIEGCFLPPNLSLHNFLAIMGLREIKELTIKSCSGSFTVQPRGTLEDTKIACILLENINETTFQLQPSCFANLANLRCIFLSENNFTTVPEDTFSGSKNIGYVSLSNNLITSLKEHMFSDLERLEELDVSHNRISHLPEQLFSRTKALLSLDLSYNLLQIIKPKLFLHLEILYELNLAHNQIRYINGEQVSQLKKIELIDLSHNQLTSLDLDISGIFMILKELDISYNNLTTLNAATVKNLINAPDLKQLKLHDNPWSCDVINSQLPILVSSKLSSILHNVTCSDGSPIEKITEKLFDRHSALTSVQIFLTQLLMVLGVAATLLLTLFVLTVLYFRNQQKVHVYCFSSRWKILRWLVSHPDFVDEDKIYDAFISFSQEDETFVAEQIVPYLEQTEDRKYKLCLHYRDWIPGEQILNQIGRSVRSSRRTIVVLSPNFLRSVWGVTEFRMAHAEALKDGTTRVIVILYREVSDEDMDEDLKKYLQTNTYLRWGSTWFWKQLTYALPHLRDRERGAGLL